MRNRAVKTSLSWSQDIFGHNIQKRGPVLNVPACS